MIHVHTLACLVLISACGYWLAKQKPRNQAHRFLLPFILLTFVAAIALIFPYAMELFVAHYSGSNYEIQVLRHRINGPYGWVYQLGATLPLLPGFGIIPMIGCRPVMMILLCFSALLPLAFRIVMA